MSSPGEFHILRKRPTADVTLAIPKAALARLRRVAESRDMSLEALLKLYIGNGLRHDDARSNDG